jgi:hypothetical protein
MSDFVHCTDEMVALHRVLIAKRQAAEDAAIAANRRASRPRFLAEWIGEGDEVVSPPIIDRPARHSTPTTMNRGLGTPKEGDE